MALVPLHSTVFTHSLVHLAPKMSIPATMKAFVIQGDHKAGVQELPVPTIDANEVLVKVIAVAQNPTDWKCEEQFLVSRFIIAQ